MALSLIRFVNEADQTREVGLRTTDLAMQFDLESLQDVVLEEIGESDETFEDPKGMDEGSEKNDAGKRHFFSGWVDCASRRGFFRYK